VRVLYLSMDPAPRMRMDPVPRMGPPLPLDSVIVGRGAGVVEASASPAFGAGDFVVGELGWQEHAIVRAEDIRKVEGTGVGLSAHLGLLASSGLTAYLTLNECAQARAGEVVLVSAAAGSVGLAACQIAKLAGCRVLALVHGPAQARFLKDNLDIDGVIEDTEVGSIGPALARAAPQGVDVFLDSVGGGVHDAVMGHIKVHGRAVLYGFISAYNAAAGTEPAYGRMYQVILRRAHLMGFLLGDYAARHAEVTLTLMTWLREGKLRSFEHITEGFDSIPEAFAAIFGEAAPGKHLVRLSPDPTLERRGGQS